MYMWNDFPSDQQKKKVDNSIDIPKKILKQKLCSEKQCKSEGKNRKINAKPKNNFPKKVQQLTTGKFVEIFEIEVALISRVFFEIFSSD